MSQWTQSTVYTGPQNPPTSNYSFTSVASDSTGNNLCAAFIKSSGSQFSASGLLASSTSGTNWRDLKTNNTFITNDIVYNSDGTILFECGFNPYSLNGYIINQYTNNGQTVNQVTNPSTTPYWSSIASNSAGTTLVAAGSLNSQFGIWTTTSNNGSALGSSWTNTNISASSDTLGSNPLAVSSNATTIIVATPGIRTTTNTTTTSTSTTVTYNTTNNIYVSSPNNSSTFTQVTGLPSINWTSVASSYDGTILLVAGNTTTTITTTTTNPTTGQPQTSTTITNTNGVVYLSMNGGISFTLVTSSSISSSSSNTWNSVAIASNTNGTNGLFVAGSSGIYVSYGSTGTNWTNIISTPNIYYMTCNSDANFVFYNTNSNILYTATPTPTPTFVIITTTPLYAGQTTLDIPSNGISIGSILRFVNQTNPSQYDVATVIRFGSVIINQPLKYSYPVGSLIYVYPPNTIIPVADICFVRNTPIETDQGIIPIHKIDPKIHTINKKKIITITKSVTEDKFLICFEKHSLGENIPSTRTIVSKYHKIQNIKGNMIDAYKFLEYYDDVKKVDYNGEILYNILMEEHATVNVNNLVCETLHPDHEIAKLYKNNYSEEYKDTVVMFMNYSKKLSTFRKG